jgi:hypothetical protein
MTISPPEKTEYAPYYESYIGHVKGDVIRMLGDQILIMQNILSDIPEEKEDFTYAEGKWTLKEVIGHIIDTERIMACRALRIARNDSTPLPGFDQDTYVSNGDFNKRTLYDLAHEFGVVRESNIILFKSFDEAALKRKGIANEKEISVRALISIIAGHTIHHLNVIKSKYLIEMV